MAWNPALTARVDDAKGRRENPMTKAELEQKFMDLATTRISRSAAALLRAAPR